MGRERVPAGAAPAGAAAGPDTRRLARSGLRALVRRWGISAASLVGGLVALLVFRRGVPHAGWLVGYVVVLWLVVAILAATREALLRRGRRGVVAAGEYTAQTLCHGVLLFVLPGYFASTTFDGPTLPFFLVLTGATLLTTLDPWYAAVVRRHPRAVPVLLGFTSFAGLNVALPLAGIPPAWAATGSAGLAALGLLPAGLAGTRQGHRRVLAGHLGLAGLAGALAWAAMPLIPPAPLHLLHPTLARGVRDLEPVEPVGPVVPAAALRRGGLVAYTPVVAPAGLRQAVHHRWRHRGRVVSTVALPTPVRGGRAAGFRTYSRKGEFPADPRGPWSVDVVTASGQLIGRLRFTVAP